MLYKLVSSNGKFDKLEPVSFKDFSSFGNNEKDLENLISNSILDVLFEDSSLMPVFQERQWQAEADIYALNVKGELTIFELKRGSAGEGAVHQALRYAQDAGRWSYSTLQEKYRKYANTESELTQAHQDAFNLEHALDAKEINNRQHLIIIGSAADDSLISAVHYWKKQGISIEFLPYRIYEIHNEKFFEFFALPYDKHKNPGDVKGVLFDTNLSWDENAIWYMMKNSRVAAFGDAKRFVEYVYPGDIVFFSHKWAGLVAAAKVKKGDIKSPNDDTLYRDVEFITPFPKKGETLKAMPFRKVSEVTGKNFFWARTIKVPYLSRDEANNLATELRKYLHGPPAGSMPRKGDVFEGKINDLGQSDADNWRRRDIWFFKHEVNRGEKFRYPTHHNHIALIDTEGQRYELNFSKPDSEKEVCLGTPGRLKPWYQKKGFDARSVNPNDKVYFEYTGTEIAFYILTEQEYSSKLNK